MQKSLPARPRLDHLRRQAKELLKQLQSASAEAFSRLRESNSDFAGRTDAELGATTFALNQAQTVIAREHGFASWTRLKRHVEVLELDERARTEAFVTSALVDHGDPTAIHFERAEALRLANPGITRASFHTALVAGEPAFVRDALRREPALAVRPGGPRNWAPLLYVCYSRYLDPRHGIATDHFVELARVLIAAGADPNSWYAVNDDPNARQTCLYGASGIANCPALTRLLLNAGADPNDAAPGFGPESLYHSCEHADTECLRLILEARPHRDKVSYCLGRCLDFENPAGVKLFLDHGADPNFVRPDGGDGSTRLLGAVRSGRSREIIELLVKAGGDWRRKDRSGLNAHRAAARLGRHDITSLFEAHGATAGDVTEIDWFLGACFSVDRNAARRLLAARPGLIRELKPADTGMIAHASWLGRSEAVQLMVELEFPIDAFGPERMNALHWAAWRGDAQLVDFLVSRGAALEIVHGYGGTVLGCAVYASMHSPFEGDFPAVVRRLLDAGAKVEGRVKFPTHLPAIDALLAPHMGSETPTESQVKVRSVRDVLAQVSSCLQPTATIGELLEATAAALLDGHRQRHDVVAIVLRNYQPGMARKTDAELFSLAFDQESARDLAARYFGFKSWADSHPSHSTTTDPDFEAAVDAVVTGDLATLNRLLAKSPALVHQRSRYGHHALLLHYVAANGVEIHRQLVPANAVAVATRLLEAGAEPDALCDTYDGGPNQTPLNLLITSSHPTEAGVKEPLVELLIDYGANPNGLNNDGEPLRLAKAFGYQETARVLSRHGAEDAARPTTDSA